MDDTTFNEMFEEELTYEETNRDLLHAIKKLYDGLTEIGILCEKDFWCCDTCGHKRISRNTNYVFYNNQTGESIVNGVRKIYITHSFDDEKSKQVLEFIKKHNEFEWDGDKMINIKISV